MWLHRAFRGDRCGRQRSGRIKLPPMPPSPFGAMAATPLCCCAYDTPATMGSANVPFHYTYCCRGQALSAFLCVCTCTRTREDASVFSAGTLACNRTIHQRSCPRCTSHPHHSRHTCHIRPHITLFVPRPALSLWNLPLPGKFVVIVITITITPASS